MAMLISKFHRLIQSKLLWATFLVIVVFTFVIWGTSIPNDTAQPRDASPGMLDGEKVPAAQFRNAYFGTYLTVVMAVGQQINITPQIDEQLRRAAWQRLAALRAAAQLGIAASDDEVAAAIQQHEGFSYEGQFNKAAYKAFVQNFLARFGFAERQFEEHVREEIVLQKIRSVIDRSALITPHELQRAFRTVTDRFQVEYTLLDRALVEAEVRDSTDAAQALYDEDPKAFTLPEQVRVDFLRIAAAPFIPRAAVTEDDVQAYYDENLSEFIDEAADTNAAEAATNLFAGMTKYRPLEDVKQDISNRLILQKALEEAQDTAMNIAVALAPDREGQAPTFEAVAEQFGCAIESTPLFALRDDVPGVENEPAFKRAAFDLTDGPETYFSNPVRGSNEVYVLALRERAAPRVPAFDEVKTNALLLARERAIADALERKADGIRADVEKALGGKIPFADAMAFQKLNVVTTEMFSAATGLEDETLGRDILNAVMILNEGEISKPIATENGLLLLHVKARKPGEAVSMEAIRPQLIEMIRRQTGRTTFDAWQNHLLRAAGFTDTRPAIPAGDDEEFEEEEPADADEQAG